MLGPSYLPEDDASYLAWVEYKITAAARREKGRRLSAHCLIRSVIMLLEQ